MKNKGQSVTLYSHIQRKSDNPDNYNEESKQRLTATDDAPGGDDAGEGSNHSKDYIQEKLNASGDHEAGEARTYTRQETIWKKSYLATRISLGSLNLCSLCLKIPILILIVRILVELIQAKKQAENATTIEPPYDDEPAAAPTGGDEGKRAMIIDSLLLVVLYVSMLLVHTLCVFSFCANKGLYHLILYLPVILVWLFVYCVSYFVKSWDGFLNFVIMIFRLAIHGIESGSPDRYELKFLRISVWFDLLAFFLSIGYIIMYFTLKKDLRNDKLCCRPQYNLLKLL